MKGVKRKNPYALLKNILNGLNHGVFPVFCIEVYFSGAIDTSGARRWESIYIGCSLTNRLSMYFLFPFRNIL